MTDWFCHCCLKKNSKRATKCVKCGRDESYVDEDYEFGLFGDGCKVFRPSHAKSLMKDNDVDSVDEHHWTSLHNACFIGDSKMAAELIRLGADVNICTMHGQTALHLAVLSGDRDTVAVILQQKPNVNASTLHEKMTPLHLAWIV